MVLSGRSGDAFRLRVPFSPSRASRGSTLRREKVSASSGLVGALPVNGPLWLWDSTTEAEGIRLLRRLRLLAVYAQRAASRSAILISCAAGGLK